MKNLWIIANWKSNKSIGEALDWVSQVGPKLIESENVKVVVCPTFSCLSEVSKAVKVGGYPLIVGSQDLSPFSAGAYTGEESASLIREFVTVSILGHSERRQNFSETDETVEKKVIQALENNIIPLVCVQGEETPVPSNCKLIAYEPVFAIGSGTPDTPDNADKVAASLKEKNGSDLDVLYGGSANSENCKGFLQRDNINGLLIGKASLDPEEFVRIIEVA